MSLSKITNESLAANTVDSDKIAANAIGTSEIANDAVTGAEIENNPTIAGNLTVSGTSALTGDATLSRAETNGTVRLNLSNTGVNGSSEYSEIKLNSTAGGTQTSIIQHRNNYGLNIGTTTDHPVYFLQNNSTAMAIDTDGNVGIGVSDPSHQLHIESTGSNTYATMKLEGQNRGGQIDFFQNTLITNQILGDQSGNLYFGTSGGFGNSSVNTKLTLGTAGDLTVNSGNLVLGTNGKGIDFAFNSNVSGMTSELLDDYEEGTATVNMVSSGATFAFGGSDGSETTLYYIKIGRLVHYFMNWDSSSTVSGTTSNTVQIQNLPFSSDYGDTFTTWFHRGPVGAFDILVTAYSTSMSFLISPTGGGMWSDMTAVRLSHVDMRLRISGTTIVS